MHEHPALTHGGCIVERRRQAAAARDAAAEQRDERRERAGEFEPASGRLLPQVHVGKVIANHTGQQRGDAESHRARHDAGDRTAEQSEEHAGATGSEPFDGGVFDRDPRDIKVGPKRIHLVALDGLEQGDRKVGDGRAFLGGRSQLVLVVGGQAFGEARFSWESTSDERE